MRVMSSRLNSSRYLPVIRHCAGHEIPHKYSLFVPGGGARTEEILLHAGKMIAGIVHDLDQERRKPVRLVVADADQRTVVHRLGLYFRARSTCDHRRYASHNESHYSVKHRSSSGSD